MAPIAWGLAVLMLYAAVPAPAEACSCVAFMFQTDLEPGAIDVPLDYVPVAGGAGIATLEFETASGIAVEFDERELSPVICGTSSELKPRSLLQANTT